MPYAQKRFTISLVHDIEHPEVHLIAKLITVPLI